MMTALMQPKSGKIKSIFFGNSQIFMISVERMVITGTSPLNSSMLLGRWEKYMEAAHIIHTMKKAHGYDSFSDPIELDIELKLKMDSALKTTLKEDNERALFLINLGKTNLRALMNNPDMGKFPCIEGHVFSGPVMFIEGGKNSAWSSDEDIRRIRQLFPNSHFVKISGHWGVQSEKSEDFLSAVVTFLQTEF